LKVTSVLERLSPKISAARRLLLVFAAAPVLMVTSCLPEATQSVQPVPTGTTVPYESWEGTWTGKWGGSRKTQLKIRPTARNKRIYDVEFTWQKDGATPGMMSDPLVGAELSDGNLMCTKGNMRIELVRSSSDSAKAAIFGRYKTPAKTILTRRGAKEKTPGW
jgi:hypothetical protein